MDELDNVRLSKDEEIREAAEELKRVYDSYRDVGFNHKQAVDMIGVMVQAVR
jgi:hypothetical protein